MECLISLAVLLGVGFLVGLFTRSKGDGFIDTIGSGCGCIIVLGIVAVIGSIVIASGS